ncbi:protein DETOXIFICATION 45, chloroplastic-like isoform X2 [Hibiscus syriacus]|uniref:protein DETOXIFICATION 45, chloroplastic-like isoform X2 n=1 Tax=Hibiscus syriacus TaxID=106335 RepID=UPI0019230D0E|nr:protein DETOXIFICATION 45, chloroplastic-like isoform X2 [Hibiscus syriacus]
MAQTCFRGSAISSGLTHRKEWNRINKYTSFHSLLNQHEICRFRKELGYKDDRRSCHLSAVHRNSLLSPLLTHRRHCSPELHSQLGSGFGVQDAEERITLNEQEDTARISSIAIENVDAHEVTETSVDVKRELIMLSLPAIAGQAIDPFAQLMETAYIGRYSSMALASAGVSVSIFNVVSKLFNIPLFSVATSFVAEDISRNAIENLSAAESTNGKTLERKQLSSVSTALLLAIFIGIIEALALSLGSGLFLKLMGVPSTSDMHVPAKHFLSLRALGAPAVVISLALQGIFRGFKDTQTPVFCLGVGNGLSIFFFPILMFGFRMGVTGAALSTVLSQYIVAFLMIRHLNKKVVLLPPKIGELQFGGYIKSGGFLIGRTLSVLITMTLGTSMAARQGSLPMAAHQICMQVWLAVSLLTDALATSGQALIASYVSKGDLQTVKEVADFVLKIGVVTGISLAAILGVSFSSLATLFTKDAEVLAIVRTGVLFVSASQPINALAFIFDGLHYGVSDFPYAACSMMLLSAVSSAFLLFAPKTLGLRGVWLGLTLFMALRMTAGFVRILSKTGPWWFLHKDLERSELSVCS